MSPPYLLSLLPLSPLFSCLSCRSSLASLAALFCSCLSRLSSLAVSLLSRRSSLLSHCSLSLSSGLLPLNLRMANLGEEFSQVDISVEEKDKLVAEVIRNVLFKTYQNSGCPIKRDELTHLITKNYRQRSLPSLVINEAKEKLASIFGYEMKELQRVRPSSTNQSRSSQQSAADVKSYIITSNLPVDIYSKYVENKENSHMIGFTFAVIGIVHLAGAKISEENLWHHLTRLGLNESDENHPLFGNIKQALETLVQQRYLQKDKVNGPEGNTLMYELAERALDTSVSEMLKEHIAE